MERVPGWPGQHRENLSQKQTNTQKKQILFKRIIYMNEQTLKKRRDSKIKALSKIYAPLGIF